MEDLQSKLCSRTSRTKGRAVQLYRERNCFWRSAVLARMAGVAPWATGRALTAVNMGTELQAESLFLLHWLCPLQTRARGTGAQSMMAEGSKSVCQRWVWELAWIFRVPFPAAMWPFLKNKTKQNKTKKPLRDVSPTRGPVRRWSPSAPGLPLPARMLPLTFEVTRRPRMQWTHRRHWLWTGKQLEIQPGLPVFMSESGVFKVWTFIKSLRNKKFPEQFITHALQLPREVLVLSKH